MPPPLIAVVDDYLGNNQTLTALLEAQGYGVVSCRSGADALTCIQRDLPNLILLDLWLETHQSGWELCAELARKPATASIPIIMMTGLPLSLVQQPGELPPALLAILEKPLNLEDLFHRIEDALSP